MAAETIPFFLRLHASYAKHVSDHWRAICERYDQLFPHSLSSASSSSALPVVSAAARLRASSSSFAASAAVVVRPPGDGASASSPSSLSGASVRYAEDSVNLRRIGGRSPRQQEAKGLRVASLSPSPSPFPSPSSASASARNAHHHHHHHHSGSSALPRSPPHVSSPMMESSSSRNANANDARSKNVGLFSDACHGKISVEGSQFSLKFHGNSETAVQDKGQSVYVVVLQHSCSLDVYPVFSTSPFAATTSASGADEVHRFLELEIGRHHQVGPQGSREYTLMRPETGGGADANSAPTTGLYVHRVIDKQHRPIMDVVGCVLSHITCETAAQPFVSSSFKTHWDGVVNFTTYVPDMDFLKRTAEAIINDALKAAKVLASANAAMATPPPSSSVSAVVTSGVRLPVREISDVTVASQHRASAADDKQRKDKELRSEYSPSERSEAKKAVAVVAAKKISPTGEFVLNPSVSYLNKLTPDLKIILDSFQVDAALIPQSTHDALTLTLESLLYSLRRLSGAVDRAFE